MPLVRSSVYSLPVTLRIWPESTASPTLSIAASQSSLVASSMSTPSALITSGTVSRISSSTVTRPLYFGSKRSLTDVDVVGLGGVDPDPGHPALPRDRELVVGVVGALGLELRRQVLQRGGDVVGVDLLEVAEVVHPPRHPVGDDDDVAAARFALVEQRLQLAEELQVAVDVLDVLDRDAGPLLELGHGAVLARVDVPRPVGDRELALDGPGLRDLRRRPRQRHRRCRRCRRPTVPGPPAASRRRSKGS